MTYDLGGVICSVMQYERRLTVLSRECDGLRHQLDETRRALHEAKRTHHQVVCAFECYSASLLVDRIALTEHTVPVLCAKCQEVTSAQNVPRRRHGSSGSVCVRCMPTDLHDAFVS